MVKKKTFTATPADIERQWWIIDASDLVLGRLASQVARLLRGKHKPYFSPNLDCGDHVIVINAGKTHLTGKKLNQKTYYRHTGYPGGLKEVTADKIIDGKFPERVVRKAVERMISRNPLGRQQISKLYVYEGAEHPHAAQQPKELDLASLNEKNSKRANQE